jgi:hypothetical protein
VGSNRDAVRQKPDAVLITTTVSTSPASPIRAKNTTTIRAIKFATNFPPNSLKNSTPSLLPHRCPSGEHEQREHQINEHFEKSPEFRRQSDQYVSRHFRNDIGAGDRMGKTALRARPEGAEKNVDNPMDQDVEIRLANLRDSPRCGAMTRSGTPCQRPALRGRNRCRLHGALSPGAPRENGNFRNGNWRADAIEERRWLRSLVQSFANNGAHRPNNSPAPVAGQRRLPPVRVKLWEVDAN